MSEQWVPGSKSELMSAIEREWKLLMEVVAQLEAKQKMMAPDAGGWSPKDNLAHLTEWMILMMGHHIDKRPAGEVFGISEEVLKDWDMEVINPVLFARNQDRSTEDVLNQANQVYKKLVAKLDTMSFEELLKPRDPNDPQKRPLLLWVLGDTSEHFSEHRQTIEKML
jgi:hypothetical protein